MKNWLFLAALGGILAFIAVTVRFGIINLDPDADLKLAERIENRFPGASASKQGLRWVVHQPGLGDTVVPGSEVLIRYGLEIFEGAMVRPLRDDVPPQTHVMELGLMPRGLYFGIIGMQVGERRTIIVPPKLAFGYAGRKPEIPPNATLVYDVTVLAVRTRALDAFRAGPPPG